MSESRIGRASAVALVGVVAMVPTATAARRLDVSASAGRVRNALDATAVPDPSAEIVEVRARTSVGEIVIGRP